MFKFNYETLIDPLLKDIRRKTPEFSGMRSGDRVVDICCGTGAQVMEYWRRGMIATGIDVNPGMLNLAKIKKNKQKAADVSFHLADATNLPFSDGYFDYASISLGLHDKTRAVRNQIISEMKRVVKPDGFLIVIDYNVPLPKNIWTFFVRTIEFLAGGSHYDAFKDFLKNKGLHDILGSNSLKEERRSLLKAGLITIVKIPNG